MEIKAEPTVTTDERFNQPNLWVLEVHFKPLRMITVTMPDPKTGEVGPKLVWYLCYRAINRPIQRKEDPKRPPIPKVDEELELPTFIPEFTLVTNDNNTQKRYVDRVMPIAQAEIEKREKHRYKNSVEIKGPIPPVTPFGSKDVKELYGVATWRGVDPATDRFKIFMTGFSNGYEVKKEPDGSERVLRKTLVQEFARYGDEFEQIEREFHRIGSPKWVYR